MIIRNRGALIVETDYFATEHAKLGLIYCSINDKTFRLLIPAGATQVDAAGAKYVIVTRGKWPDRGWRECLEFVWEDESDAPFHVLIDVQQADVIPVPEDAGRTDLRCIGYAPDLSVLFDLPARYRAVPRVPYLKPWK